MSCGNHSLLSSSIAAPIDARLRTVLTDCFRSKECAWFISPRVDLLWFGVDQSYEAIDSRPPALNLTKLIQKERQPGFRVSRSDDDELLDRIPFRLCYHASWVLHLGSCLYVGYWCALANAADLPSQIDIENVFDAILEVGQKLQRDGKCIGSIEPLRHTNASQLETRSLHVLHDMMTPFETLSLLVSELETIESSVPPLTNCSNQRHSLIEHMKSVIVDVRSLLHSELLPASSEATPSSFDPRKSFGLTTLLDELYSRFSFLAGQKRISLEFKVRRNWRINVARIHLWRILSNLLANAVRHSDHFPVTLTISSSAPLRIVIRNRLGDRAMAAQSRANVSNGSKHWLYGGESFGMGLEIVERLASEAGLQLRTRFSPPYVDCFILFPHLGAELIEEPPLPEQSRILVVDDNPIAARLRARELSRYRAKVEWSADLDAVCKRLAQEADLAVVLDYYLGEKTAEEVLEGLPHKLSGVVLCTGDIGISERKISRFFSNGRCYDRYPVVDKSRSAATICELLSLQERCRKPTMMLLTRPDPGVKIEPEVAPKSLARHSQINNWYCAENNPET